jgi:hypothetical protein
MNQEELERLGARLGIEVADRVDPERVAPRVLARLHEARAPALSRGQRGLRRIAAMAAVAVLGVVLWLVAKPASGPVDRVVTPGTVLQELDELNADQLEALLETMPITASVMPPEAAPLEGLDTIKLERLLRSLEG